MSRLASAAPVAHRCVAPTELRALSHPLRACHRYCDCSEFHEYAVEYSATHVAFAVDGQVIGNTTNGQLTLEGRARVYDVPYYFILNTAVSTAPHEVGWVHPVTPETVFPTYHRIDSVRVVQRKGNGE